MKAVSPVITVSPSLRRFTVSPLNASVLAMVEPGVGEGASAKAAGASMGVGAGAGVTALIHPYHLFPNGSELGAGFDTTVNGADYLDHEAANHQCAEEDGVSLSPNLRIVMGKRVSVKKMKRLPVTANDL